MTDAERQRARRASAGAILLAGDRTGKLMARAADAQVAQAAQELGSRSGERKAVALLVLLAAGRRMAEGLTGAVLAGRKEARSLAARRLGAELELAGVSGETGSPALIAASHLARFESDGVEAQMAAESLAGQWRALASRAVLQAQRLGEDVARAVSATRRPLERRIARTAETESTRAYNDEHAERLRDLVARGDLDPDRVLREWSALLDACEDCWPHDGERVGVSDSFSGGDEPGDVHPRCRCTALLVSAA